MASVSDVQLHVDRAAAGWSLYVTYSVTLDPWEVGHWFQETVQVVAMLDGGGEQKVVTLEGPRFEAKADKFTAGTATPRRTPVINPDAELPDHPLVADVSIKPLLAEPGHRHSEPVKP